MLVWLGISNFCAIQMFWTNLLQFRLFWGRLYEVWEVLWAVTKRFVWILVLIYLRVLHCANPTNAIMQPKAGFIVLPFIQKNEMQRVWNLSEIYGEKKPVSSTHHGEGKHEMGTKRKKSQNLWEKTSLLLFLVGSLLQVRDCQVTQLAVRVISTTRESLSWYVSLHFVTGVGDLSWRPSLALLNHGAFRVSVRCGGFSYDKITYNCTIVGIPEKMRFLPEDAVTVKHSDTEAYFHKVSIYLFNLILHPDAIRVFMSLVACSAARCAAQSISVIPPLYVVDNCLQHFWNFGHLVGHFPSRPWTSICVWGNSLCFWQLGHHILCMYKVRPRSLFQKTAHKCIKKETE